VTRSPLLREHGRVQTLLLLVVGARVPVGISLALSLGTVSFGVRKILEGRWLMAKTNAVLERARTVLLDSRQQLQTELDAVDRALTALQGIGGRPTNGRVRRRRRRTGGASPKLLAALKRARAARQRKIAERKAAAR